MHFNSDPRRQSRSTGKNLGFTLLLFVMGAIGGGLIGGTLFLVVMGGSAEPSTEISAPTLSLAEFGSDDVEPTSTEAIAQLLPTPTIAATSTPVTVVEPSEPAPTPTIAEATATPLPPTPVPAQLYRIVPARSQARFSVYETFPVGTAIGSTSEIAGDIVVDFESPTNSQVGTIRINLRTLVTDDPLRDRSIRCCVLLTAQDAYEFADFVPTNITALPTQIVFGEPVQFQVTGDLTVRGTTQPATFDVEVVVAESELRGMATTIVDRRDYGILNDADNGFDYHGIANEVTLEFEFVAQAATQEETTSE